MVHYRERWRFMDMNAPFQLGDSDVISSHVILVWSVALLLQELYLPRRWERWMNPSGQKGN